MSGGQSKQLHHSGNWAKSACYRGTKPAGSTRQVNNYVAFAASGVIVGPTLGDETGVNISATVVCLVTPRPMYLIQGSTYADPAPEWWNTRSCEFVILLDLTPTQPCR